MSNIRDDGGRVTVVGGMQIGSEGKGKITTYLAPIMSMGVRVGGPNAGHTGYWNGMRFVMHQLPCTWVNPVAQLVLGVGAIISLPVLLKEIAFIEAHMPGVRSRLFVDENAHVITPEHVRRESKTNLAKRIGSTSATAGQGIGAARAAKVMREESCLRAFQVPELRPFCVDTARMVNKALDDGQYVLLEGTQGFKLSIEHGEFPFVTSCDTTVAALAASVGISLHAFQCDIIGVTRTYPIRVAGNSGPFGADSEELSWSEVACRAGSTESITERTTVTQNVRRVGTFSMEDFVKACQVNRPTEIALTFTDYLDRLVYGREDITYPVEEFIADVEALAGVPVTLIGTGPETIIDLNEYRRRMLRKLAC